MVEELDREVKDGDVVILQGLDNSCFYVMDPETGGMRYPEKLGEGGKFHVDGKLYVTKDIQTEMLLERILPLLTCKPDNLKVLVSPTARFLESCCPEHKKDEEELKEEGEQQLKGLETLRRDIRAKLMAKKIKNVVLFDSMEVIGSRADLKKAKESLVDNVHLTSGAYKQLAGGIVKCASEWMASKKRKAEEAMGGSSKKSRMEVVIKESRAENPRHNSGRWGRRGGGDGKFVRGSGPKRGFQARKYY